MLSYFGCDQSQVQRYLTAKSVQEGRHSLLMSAFVKIPLQALVLLVGVLVFVFYLFNQPPMLFRPVVVAEDREERARPASSRRSSRSSRRRSRRAATASTTLAEAGDGRRPRLATAFRAADDRAQRASAAARPALARDVGEARLQGLHRRHADAGRQLRLPDVRHDEAADGPGRV